VRGHVSTDDLYLAITDLSVEVQALNMSIRELMDEEETVDPPAWINSDERTERLIRPEDFPPPERGCPGASAAYVVLAAIVGSLVAFVFVLWMIGS
jgi:hypothetical protein